MAHNGSRCCRLDVPGRRRIEIESQRRCSQIDSLLRILESGYPTDFNTCRHASRPRHAVKYSHHRGTEAQRKTILLWNALSFRAKRGISPRPFFGTVCPAQGQIPRCARNDTSWFLGARQPTGTGDCSENNSPPRREEWPGGVVGPPHRNHPLTPPYRGGESFSWFPCARMPSIISRRAAPGSAAVMNLSPISTAW